MNAQQITIVVLQDHNFVGADTIGVHVYAGLLSEYDAVSRVAQDLGVESGDEYTVAQMHDAYNIDVRHSIVKQ